MILDNSYLIRRVQTSLFKVFHLIFQENVYQLWFLVIGPILVLNHLIKEFRLYPRP